MFQSSDIDQTQAGSDPRNTTRGRKQLCTVLVLTGICVIVGILGLNKKRTSNRLDRKSAFQFQNVNYQCSAGMYIVDGQGCLYCPLGHLCSQVDTSTPVPCGIGQYQDKIGQVACPTAPPGTYTNGTGTIHPVQCPIGTFQALSGQSGCIDASPGTFVSTPGQISESNCAPNFYQPIGGQSSCLPCPAGEIQPLPGQTSCSCAPSNTSSLTAKIRVTRMDQISHLGKTGCPGAMFIYSSYYYVGSPVDCSSYVQQTTPNITGLNIITSGYWSSGILTTRFEIYQSGADIVWTIFSCAGSSGVCSHVLGPTKFTAANQFHIVFEMNRMYKKYQKMIPSYAQVLSWAKSGYAPAFRVDLGSLFWYFETDNALLIDSVSAGTYLITGTKQGILSGDYYTLNLQFGGDMLSNCHYVTKNSGSGSVFRRYLYMV